MKQITVVELPNIGLRRINGTTRYATECYGEYHVGNEPIDLIIVDAQHHDDNTWSDFKFYGNNEIGSWYELVDGVDIDQSLRQDLIEEHNNEYAVFNEDDDGHEDDGDEEDLADDD